MTFAFLLTATFKEVSSLSIRKPVGIRWKRQTHAVHGGECVLECEIPTEEIHSWEAPCTLCEPSVAHPFISREDRDQFSLTSVTPKCRDSNLFLVVSK